LLSMNAVVYRPAVPWDTQRRAALVFNRYGEGFIALMSAETRYERIR
jgi:hypothetical protein